MVNLKSARVGKTSVKRKETNQPYSKFNDRVYFNYYKYDAYNYQISTSCWTHEPLEIASSCHGEASPKSARWYWRHCSVVLTTVRQQSPRPWPQDWIQPRSRAKASTSPEIVGPTRPVFFVPLLGEGILGSKNHGGAMENARSPSKNGDVSKGFWHVTIFRSHEPIKH